MSVFTFELCTLGLVEIMVRANCPHPSLDTYYYYQIFNFKVTFFMLLIRLTLAKIAFA